MESGFSAMVAKAEAGDAESRYLLAKALLDGAEGVPRNPEEAAAWLRAAAGQDHPAAAVALARLHLEGLGAPQDKRRAEGLLRSAAGLGSAEALTLLGRLAELGDLDGESGLEAARYFGEAEALGSSEAGRRLGDLRYKLGREGPAAAVGLPPARPDWATAGSEGASGAAFGGAEGRLPGGVPDRAYGVAPGGRYRSASGPASGSSSGSASGRASAPPGRDAGAKSQAQAERSRARAAGLRADYEAFERTGDPRPLLARSAELMKSGPGSEPARSGLQILERLAGSGVAEAMYRQGVSVLGRDFGPSNPAKAKVLFVRASELGHFGAREELRRLAALVAGA